MGRDERGAGVFMCKGCTAVATLVGEVEDLRQMVESMKRVVTGQGLEEKTGETGVRLARLEEADEKDKKKCKGVMAPGHSST